MATSGSCWWHHDSWSRHEAATRHWRQCERRVNWSIRQYNKQLNSPEWYLARVSYREYAVAWIPSPRGLTQLSKMFGSGRYRKQKMCCACFNGICWLTYRYWPGQWLICRGADTDTDTGTYAAASLCTGVFYWLHSSEPLFSCFSRQNRAKHFVERNKWAYSSPLLFRGFACFDTSAF